jgi:signal transduction histidine kinase
LLGLAQILRDPARVLPPLETAQRIETLAGRTLALADGFIALARAHVMEPGRFDYLDLRDALQDAIDEVWAAAQAKHVAIETRVPTQVAGAYGDRQMLARALANLINNAVKYSTSNAAVLIALDRQGEHWAIAVRDEGPGIPLDRHGHLFQRFRRAVHHGESDPGGVGLGLAFVRVVAHKHGGSVHVESDAGHGATFSLVIPAIELE